MMKIYNVVLRKDTFLSSNQIYNVVASSFDNAVKAANKVIKETDRLDAYYVESIKELQYPVIKGK